MALTRVRGSVWNNIDNYERANVKDLGAVGDGDANDTDAIAAALAVGGLVYFPSGTYLTDTITIPVAGLTICGDGQNSTIIKLNNSVESHLIDNSYDDFEIRNLTLDGNTTNNAATSNNTGLVLRAGSRSRLRDVEIKSSTTHNMHVLAATEVDVANCRFHSTGAGNGVLIGLTGNSTNDIQFSNCNFDNNFSHGCEVGATGSTVRRVTFSNCIANDNGQSGSGTRADMTAVGAGGGGLWAVDGAADIIFDSCIARQNWGDGLSAHGADRVTMSNCVASEARMIDNTQTSGPTADEPNNGFVCSNGSAHVAFNGCISHTNTANGMTISSNTVNTTVDSCIIYNNAQGSTVWAGIQFTTNASPVGSGANYVTISNCTIFDNQGSKTQAYGIGVSTAPQNVNIQGCHLYGNVTAAIDTGDMGSDRDIRIENNRGFNPVGTVTAPTISFGSGVINEFPHPVWVYVTGGSVTAIYVGATLTGLLTGSFYLDSGTSIQVNGSGAAWVWRGV